MDHEAVITLDVDHHGDCVLVSCQTFPLLNLQFDDVSEQTIVDKVFPVLKEMVEHKVGGAVELRLVPAFDTDSEKGDLLSPHIIAKRMALHVE